MKAEEDEDRVKQVSIHPVREALAQLALERATGWREIQKCLEKMDAQVVVLDDLANRLTDFIDWAEHYRDRMDMMLTDREAEVHRVNLERSGGSFTYE